jgi:hypothetical protein
MTRIVEFINGFVITERLSGTTARYYQAKRGDKVFVSTCLSYIRNKTKLYGK